MPEFDELVHLVGHRAEWASQGSVESQRISQAVGLSEVQHIGSTAVPGLAAKPTIDLMVGVAEYPAPWLEPLLKKLGYEAFGEAGVPGRAYFRHRAGESYNVHVVLKGGAHWRHNLAFREHLRKSAAARQRYAQAKVEAIACGANTLLSYSAAKAPTIAALLQEALASHNDG